MSRHHVQLTSAGGPTARLLLDGEDISRSVTSVDVSASGRDGLGVLIRLSATPVTVDLADVEVWIPEETRSLLVRLGWTPPVEEGTDVMD